MRSTTWPSRESWLPLTGVVHDALPPQLVLVPFHFFQITTLGPQLMPSIDSLDERALCRENIEIFMGVIGAVLVNVYNLFVVG
jgi:hypothetical protein